MDKPFSTMTNTGSSFKAIRNNGSMNFDGDGVFCRPHRCLQLLPVFGEEKASSINLFLVNALMEGGIWILTLFYCLWHEGGSDFAQAMIDMAYGRHSFERFRKRFLLMRLNKRGINEKPPNLAACGHPYQNSHNPFKTAYLSQLQILSRN